MARIVIMLFFFSLMCWIDEHISHPLWNWMTPDDNDKLDVLFFRFCLWSQLGYDKWRMGYR